MQPWEEPDVHANFSGFLKKGAQVTANAGTKTNSSGEWAETTAGFIRLKQVSALTTGIRPMQPGKIFSKFHGGSEQLILGCLEKARARAAIEAVLDHRCRELQYFHYQRDDSNIETEGLNITLLWCTSDGRATW